MEPVSLHLPQYESFSMSIEALVLPTSPSEIHGMMCGYLCAGADKQGESYLRALLSNKKDRASQDALLSLFSVFSISQQQLNHFDFEFEMLLPDEEEPLPLRAQSFCEWCEGFTQGLHCAGIDFDDLEEEDAQDALKHLVGFAELDYDSVEISEADEKAFVEVSEYARMAVLRLHHDLTAQYKTNDNSETSH